MSEKGEGNAVAKMWWWFVERDRDGGVVCVRFIKKGRKGEE